VWTETAWERGEEYPYDELLDRIHLMNDTGIKGGAQKYTLIPPEVTRVGLKKVFVRKSSLIS